MQVVIARTTTSTDKPSTVADSPNDTLVHFLFFTSSSYPALHSTQKS